MADIDLSIRKQRRQGAIGPQKHGHSVGGKQTAEYRTWAKMLTRCYDPLEPRFKDYGGRGIEVCVRWRESFANFFEDMGPKPTLKHSIERIDNDGPYSPDNCKWATMKEQQRNRRDCIYFTANGQTRNCAEWAEILGTSHKILWQRKMRGWPDEDIINFPIHSIGVGRRKSVQPKSP